MTDNRTLYKGLSNAAWGYFLLYVNFSLSFGGVTINVLPPFAGMLLLRSAIGKLSSGRRDLELLRPLTTLLAAWHFADWALALAGTDLEKFQLTFLSLLVLAATLYFHFQFLTDMAAMAEQYQPEGERLDRDILGCRTDMLLLTTAASLLGYLMDALPRIFDGDLAMAMVTALTICLVAASLILTVLLMLALFRLRRCVRDMEPGLQ